MNVVPPPGFVTIPVKGAVLVIPERVYLAGLKLGKMLRRREAHAQLSTTVRTFQSEARRLIRQHGAGEPTVDQLGDALYWLLFTRPRRRHRGHGKPWQRRAFFGGHYEPRTR